MSHFWRGWFSFAVANLIVVIGFVLQTSYSILNLDIARSLSLSLVDNALVASIYAYSFAFTQLFSGALLAYFGTRRIFLMALFILLVGALFMSIAISFPLLLLSQVLLGVGSSFGFVGAGFSATLWFDKSRFTLLLALVQSFSALMAFIVQYISGFLLDYGVSWRFLIFFMFLISLFSFIFALIVVRDPKTDSSTVPLVAKKRFHFSLFSYIALSLFQVLRIPRVLVATFIGSMIFGIYMAVALFWGGRFLLAYGYTPSTAGLIYSVCWLGLAFSPFVSLLTAFLSRFNILAFGSIVQALCLLSIVYTPFSHPLVFAFAFFIFGMATSCVMQSFTLAAQSTPSAISGSATALVNTAIFLMIGVFLGLPHYFFPDASLLSIRDYRFIAHIFSSFLLSATFLAFFYPLFSSSRKP